MVSATFAWSASINCNVASFRDVEKALVPGEIGADLFRGGFDTGGQLGGIERDVIDLEFFVAFPVFILHVGGRAR